MCASKKSATTGALSLGRKHSTGACDVRAPHRAGWSRSIPHGSPLRQRDGRLPRCTAVLRRTSRGLQTSSLLAYVRKSKTRQPRALSLSLRRKRSTRACDVRARCRAGWSRSISYGSPLRQRDGRLPRCTAVLRRASRGVQTSSLLAYVRKSNSANRARSLSLSGGSAPRALATCARAAALVGVGPYPMEAHCASGTAVSLGARPCSDVPAAASKRASLLAYVRKSKIRQPRALSLSLSLSPRRKRSTRACDVRAPRRAGWSRSIPYGSPLRQQHGRLPHCTAVLHVPALALTSREVGCACSALARHCALSLSLRRKRSTRASDVHARCRAGWSRSLLYGSPLR